MKKIETGKVCAMLGEKCSKCGSVLDGESVYCNECGAKCETDAAWICLQCQKENPIGAKFCKKCGAPKNEAKSSMQKEQNIKEKFTQWRLTTKHSNYIIGGIICSILLVIGSYFYFHAMSENRYLTKYAEAVRKISSANEVLTTNTNPDSLKTNQIATTQQLILQQKAEIDNLEKDFSSEKGFDKYEAQHKNMLALLQKESAILQKTTLIITKPLNAEADALLGEMKENVDEAKGMAEKVQVPNVTIALSADMAVLPHHLTIFVEEQRRLNKEKVERLNAMNEFFKSMDSMIQRYNNAKTDLGGMLGSIRNGGYTWGDYFSSLYQARGFRVGMRNQVDHLNAPKGAEEMKRQYSEVLTMAIQYCDKMNAAANVEFHSNFYAAQPKYNEAKEVNDRVQSMYSEFITNYQAEKTRLTTIENL